MSVTAEATASQVDNLLEDEALVEEDLLDELENGEIPAHIREARLAEMKQQMVLFKNQRDKGYGKYMELEKEKDVLDITTKEEKVIIHFFMPDFRTCSILDGHLKTLAEKHFNTKFAKVQVKKCKFLAGKLKIQVLPTVLSFKDGIVIDRLTGFEELGNTENFSTVTLERRLAKSGVILLPDVEVVQNKTIMGFDRKRRDDSSSDED